MTSMWLLPVAAAVSGADQAPAQPVVPTVPAAIVSGNTVTHPQEKVAVSVPPTATYAGAERFNLYGVADAEIHVFVEADAARRMQRLYWVQFESYLPNPMNHSYNYAEGNTRFTLWGTPTWLTWGPRPANAPARAGSDRESVMRILAKAGYSIPPEVMNVRMVQLLDDPEGTGRGRRELMIIYSEDLAPTGKSMAELVVDGKLNESAWKPLEKPLIDRATTSVRVERL